MKEYIIKEDQSSLTVKEVIDFFKSIPENTPVFLTSNTKTTNPHKIQYIENFNQVFIISNE